ncbi:hypothetical protein IV203_025425 [Nitzschia inconspicua]|uniref:Uncharacterized protein n=1 Tax=Nitzschia inconspicua TaxID=303405 RepID=A0A9K3PAH9_9STRA|nr:hypothetical protein IV203_028207 [Nitzschia inconspicua]KAG7362541.1 hypothetical protein IV203_025425 [Nitzschia inconspicua]
MGSILRYFVPRFDKKTGLYQHHSTPTKCRPCPPDPERDGLRTCNGWVFYYQDWKLVDSWKQSSFSFFTGGRPCSCLPNLFDAIRPIAVYLERSSELQSVVPNGLVKDQIGTTRSTLLSDKQHQLQYSQCNEREQEVDRKEGSRKSDKQNKTSLGNRNEFSKTTLLEDVRADRCCRLKVAQVQDLQQIIQVLALIEESCVGYGMYLECTRETPCHEFFQLDDTTRLKLSKGPLKFHEFKDKLSIQMLTYAPANVFYPGDRNFREVTEMSIEKRNARKRRATTESMPTATTNPARSVIMHRASYRIDVFLYGATTNGALSVYFRQALTNRGVPEGDFITIQKCVADSVHLEMRGDMLRQFGMAQRAAHEYQKAVKVEESAFGRENPCLATLWRKLACLAVVIRADTSHWSKDIDEMDRLDGPWLKHQYNSKAASTEGAEKTDNKDGRRRRTGCILPANVGRAIEQGDAYYQAMDFAQAVGRYSHAVAIHKSRRPSSRSTSRSSSRDRNRSCKDGNSRSRSRSVSKEVSHHGSKSPRRRGTRGETRPTTNPKSAEEKVDNEHAMQQINKLLNDSKFATREKRDGVVTSTVLYSDSKEPRMEQERSTEAPPPSLPVHHQTVISTSTRRVKRNHSNSTSTRSSSMYQAIKNYVDPQRPKSDSHVTKLAKKVVRKTSKHIRKTLGGSSIHGGTAINRPSKSTTKEDCDDVDDDAVSLTEPSRPKSESYAYLASPPMTPLVNNTTAKLSDILKVSSPNTSSNHHRGLAEFYGEDEDEDDGNSFYHPSTSTTTSHRRYK